MIEVLIRKLKKARSVLEGFRGGRTNESSLSEHRLATFKPQRYAVGVQIHPKFGVLPGVFQDVSERFDSVKRGNMQRSDLPLAATIAAIARTESISSKD